MLDVPLLIEAGLWKWVGEIVVVYVWVYPLRLLSSCPCASFHRHLPRVSTLPGQSSPNRSSDAQIRASPTLAPPLPPPRHPLPNPPPNPESPPNSPSANKTPYATAVLDNSGTPTDLSAQLDRLVARWRAQQGGTTGWWWRLCWIPPVGVTAGGLCLLVRAWRCRRGVPGRKRRRGTAEPDRVEMDDLSGGARRRTGSGSGGAAGAKESVYD